MTYRTLQRTLRRTGGFTLVELMIALTIGMLIMAGVMLIFANSSQARTELEKANRQIENGRYAVQLLTDDLRLAGYYGEYEPQGAVAGGVLDACMTTGLEAGMSSPVQGYDDSAAISCITDRRDNTDVLVVRHASACVAGDAECGPMTSGVTYFQASLCYDATELGNSAVQDNHYKISTTASALGLHNRDCKTTASLRRYQTHIYFIANNDKDSDGVPTLKRIELGANGWSSPVPLVEGIENLQIEYGVDSDNDGMPNLYAAAPTAWSDVVAVKFNILARNTEKSMGYTDSKTYALGFNANGTLNTVGPFNDNIKRHVYEAVVKIDNTAGRKG